MENLERLAEVGKKHILDSMIIAVERSERSAFEIEEHLNHPNCITVGIEREKLHQAVHDYLKSRYTAVKCGLKEVNEYDSRMTLAITPKSLGERGLHFNYAKSPFDRFGPEVIDAYNARISQRATGVTQ